MDRWLRDLRYAVRALRAAPGFAAVAILSIAIAIGANTTVFSFVNAVFFAPLPFRDADRLLDISEHNPAAVCTGCGVGTSYALFQDLQQRTKSFSSLGAHTSAEFVVNDGGAPVRVAGAAVSAGLLEMLGAVQLAGRLIHPSDDRAGAARVALIAEPFWRAHFAAAVDIVGRQVRLNGDWFTIAGVVPSALRFPDRAQVWVPIAPLFATVERGERTIGVIGRLARDVEPAVARAELATLGSALEREYPASNAGWTLHATALRSDLAGDYRMFWMLLAAVTFVLLVACANLAGLLLARGFARRRELGVRLALGAERARIVRLLLSESVLIALSGALLGLLLAWWCIDLLAVLAPQALPFWSELTLDWRVLAFTSVLALVTGVGFGLLPALEASRVDVASFVREGAHGSAGRSATRLRRMLGAGEIAAAMVLLTGAGLTAKSFLRSRSLAQPYETRNLMRGEVRLLGSRYDSAAARGQHASDAAAERHVHPAALPALRAAAVFTAGRPAHHARVPHRR